MFPFQAPSVVNLAHREANQLNVAAQEAETFGVAWRLRLDATALQKSSACFFLFVFFCVCVCVCVCLPVALWERALGVDVSQSP